MTPIFAADLIAALLAGLAGSLHCMAMCGPLASVGCRGGFTRVSSVGPLLFVTGKLASYSILGLFAGWLGATLIGTGWFGRATAILSLAGGIIMITVIVMSRIKTINGGATGISVIIARAAMKFGKNAPLLLGVAAALLPCGLLYAMVARSAASGAAIHGMNLMQAFGLGTTPALLGVGTIARWIPRRWSRFGTAFGEIILVLTAALLIWRGIGGLMADATGPACCQ